MQTGNSYTVHVNSQSNRKRKRSNTAAWIQIPLKTTAPSFHQSTQIPELTKQTFTKKKKKISIEQNIFPKE